MSLSEAALILSVDGVSLSSLRFHLFNGVLKSHKKEQAYTSPISLSHSSAFQTPTTGHNPSPPTTHPAPRCSRSFRETERTAEEPQWRILQWKKEDKTSVLKFHYLYYPSLNECQNSEMGRGGGGGNVLGDVVLSHSPFLDQIHFPNLLYPLSPGLNSVPPKNQIICLASLPR